MKKFIILAQLLFLACISCSQHPTECQLIKPRTIVTCDPELDDNNSMIRFLLHATDFQIDGLIYTSSRFHWDNDGSGRTQFIEMSEYDQLGLGPQTSWRWQTGERFIHDIIDAYEQCYPNLKVHDASYPTPEYLRSVTCYGNCAFEGDYSYDSEGSELIVKNILDNQPGPLYLQAWGGCSTIAAALRSIADTYGNTPEWENIVQKINEKVVLCLSGDQDNTYNNYIAVEWPGLWVQNESGNMGYWDPAKSPDLTNPEWTARWMRRGPLGSLVRCWGDGKQMVPGDRYDPIGLTDGKTAVELKAEGYVMWCPIQPTGTLYSDGDSNCFYQLIDNGLRAYEDPTWGGWNGRWDIRKGESVSGHPAYMLNDLRSVINGDAQQMDMSAWMAFFGQREEDHTFPNMQPERNLSEAARMAWSVTPRYEDANHYPVLNGPLCIEAKPGEVITIDAEASDPDGNDLQLQWWYFPVGTYVLNNSQTLSVDSPNAASTKFAVPADAHPGETLHFVLQAIDNGEPQLTRYLRTVIKIKN